MRIGPVVPRERRVQMGHHLVAEKIEIHPRVVASSLGASEKVAVKTTRLGDVADGKREMERTERTHGLGSPQ